MEEMHMDEFDVWRSESPLRRRSRARRIAHFPHFNDAMSPNIINLIEKHHSETNEVRVYEEFSRLPPPIPAPPDYDTDYENRYEPLSETRTDIEAKAAKKAQRRQKFRVGFDSETESKASRFPAEDMHDKAATDGDMPATRKESKRPQGLQRIRAIGNRKPSYTETIFLDPEAEETPAVRYRSSPVATIPVATQPETSAIKQTDYLGDSDNSDSEYERPKWHKEKLPREMRDARARTKAQPVSGGLFGLFGSSSKLERS